LKQDASVHLAVIHLHTDGTHVWTRVDDQGVARVVSHRGEMKTDFVTETKTSAEHFPIGAGETKGDSFFV